MSQDNNPSHPDKPMGIKDSNVFHTLIRSDPSLDRDDLEITLADIMIVEKMFGLVYNEKERDLMHVAVNAYLDDYRNSRKLKIPNHIPPPLYFNPTLPNMSFSRSSFQTKFSQSRAYEVPGDLEELAFWPILDIANLIYLEKLTSTDLTKMFIDRIKKYDSTLKSVITLTEPLAIEQANRVDDDMRKNKHRGILHGIPYGVKDLLAHPDYSTTWGTPPFKDQHIDTTATVIKRLEAKGAILIAKLSLGELAWGNVWFGGETKTPWNIEFGSGGSSAGSAAATAAGLVAFSIGSETWGSIINPSSRCGVTGLRPTFGRVSRHGAMSLAWSMDKIGPICKTVEDCAIVLDAIRGSDGLDPTVIEAPFNYDYNENPMDIKVGYLKSEFDKETEKEFKPFTDAAINQLKLSNIDLVELELPDINADRIAFILAVEAATSFDELTLSGKLDKMIRQGDDTWPNMFRQARLIPAVEYLKANRIRYLLMQEMEKIFSKVDVIVAPSLGKNLLVTNLTGHPSVVVPIGFQDNGLPVSISFTGGLFKESQALRIAKEYQDRTKFHSQIPPNF
ncbi:MAG: Glutamyl-tRNA(Gln) amidotransferase subunit A [Candidatus Heimdallarchaeota archaeon LC_2]|nr:MAG: Glutamyl-tRNA(Gln) amidotransferase subunit A [Candidatus Heimdallarchaeota archaeon LC_2]